MGWNAHIKRPPIELAPHNATSMVRSVGCFAAIFESVWQQSEGVTTEAAPRSQAKTDKTLDEIHLGEHGL